MQNPQVIRYLHRIPRTRTSHIWNQLPVRLAPTTCGEPLQSSRPETERVREKVKTSGLNNKEHKEPEDLEEMFIWKDPQMTYSQDKRLKTQFKTKP
ncbi:hypothetical protein CRENBAI_018069 [Crenichthys baileyi]|uniref:Uncharacterized protein n=1 Tax=Crenichthys baileyi TaxID=28760 RepID=A0AAV9RQV2_9TELE